MQRPRPGFERGSGGPWQALHSPLKKIVAERLPTARESVRLRFGCKWAKGKSPMKPTRKVSRRSFFGTVAGGVAATAALVGVVGSEEAEAQSGCTDSDTGGGRDPAGNGRRCRRRTGITDRDTGSGRDPAGYGRGRRRSGCTDNDTGRGSDPAGDGRCRRRQTGCTDSDTGSGSDSAGNGRCVNRRRSCSDSDSGSYSDPVGRGRRC
jgi:hypothetical protein